MDCAKRSARPRPSTIRMRTNWSRNCRRDRRRHRLSALSDRQEQASARACRLRRIRLRALQGRDRFAAVRASGICFRPHQRRHPDDLPTAQSPRPWSSSVALAHATTPRACPTARRSAACTPPSTPCCTSTKCMMAQAHVFYMDIRRAERTTTNSSAAPSSRTARSTIAAVSPESPRRTAS